MLITSLARLRCELAARGLTPASAVPEASGGQTEDACIRPARLVEGSSLAWHVVGPPERWSEPVAFLDGVQRSYLLAYAGAAPIVLGKIAAAVRERIGGELRTVLVARRVLVLARAPALEAAGDLLKPFDGAVLPSEEPAHPVRDLAAAARALDRARGALELELGERYRTTSQHWLVVDGAISESPRWSSDPRIVGVSKSHATLPFEGPDLDRFLRLPDGQRSSVYQPASRSVAPVREWALRLWPWEGKDLFHGLVRVQVAPQTAEPATVDLLSRRLLAERAPLSTPDRRWDRLLYGIHSVETFLRARESAAG